MPDVFYRRENDDWWYCGRATMMDEPRCTPEEPHGGLNGCRMQVRYRYEPVDLVVDRIAPISGAYCPTCGVEEAHLHLFYWRGEKETTE